MFFQPRDALLPVAESVRGYLSYSGSIPKPVIVAVYVILLYHVGCRGYACMALNGGAALEDLNTVSSVGFCCLSQLFVFFNP
jgi:hypothetical protein